MSTDKFMHWLVLFFLSATAAMVAAITIAMLVSAWRVVFAAEPEPADPCQRCGTWRTLPEPPAYALPSAASPVHTGPLAPLLQRDFPEPTGPATRKPDDYHLRPAPRGLEHRPDVYFRPPPVPGFTPPTGARP